MRPGRERGGHNDESDDDEGFKVTNSGRMRGSLPNFLPRLAADPDVVNALYRSNRAGRIGTIDELGEDHPLRVRRRLVAEIARREWKAPPQERLPPLPLAAQSRRKFEALMDAGKALRLANSSPKLSVGRRAEEVAAASGASRAKLGRARAAAGWRKDDFNAGRPTCFSCPPELGLGGGDSRPVPVDRQFEKTPWADPAMVERAAAVKAEELRQLKAKRQAERDSEYTKADLEAAKARLTIPLNDATADSPRAAYNYRRFARPPAAHAA